MSFDPDQFMTSTVDGPLETEIKLVPAGEYRDAYIDDFKSDAFNLREGNAKNTGKPYSFLEFNIPVIINDPKALQEIGRDRAVVYKRIIIDRDDNGGIARGANKNVELGRILDAAGLNGPGSSPQDLRGKGPFVVTVAHESGKREDGSEWKRAAIGRIVRQS